MSSELDVPAVWALLRALSRRVAEGGAPVVEVADGRGHDALGLSRGPDDDWALSRPVAPDARALLELYLPLAAARQVVVGQIGQSLDGRIATESGHSHYVTGPRDRERLHRVRALVDAVVVGAGTVEADDPRLTVRHAEGGHPVRVVLDPRGRTGAARRVFSDGMAPTLWIRATGAPDDPRVAPRGAETLLLRADEDGVIAPRLVVRALAERGLRRVLVEGGGETVSRFLRAHALDRLHVTVAPFVMGAGRQGLSLPAPATLAEVSRPGARHFTMGEDMLFDLDLSGSPPLRLRVP